MKSKIGIAFILFMIVSFAVLFLYNQNRTNIIEENEIYRQLATDAVIHQIISDRIAIIIYIFFMVTVCILYLVYGFYKVMYNELADRMEMLDASRNDLQTTYDSVAMLFVEIDAEMNIININNAFSEKVGKKKNSIIGQKFDEAINFQQKSLETLSQKLKDAFEESSNERTEIEEQGKIFEVFVFPMNVGKAANKKVLMVLNDVTTARAAERQMLQDNKMIAVGQLAAGVAHEIRNPLGIIRNYCYVLKNSGEYDRAVIDKAIASIEKAVDKSGRIIDNLLDFSRISSNKRELVNLNKFLYAIISLEQNVLVTKNVSVTVDCDDDIEIFTIAESLEIILLNLMINAVDAMPHGGNIKISAALVQDAIKIKVADTGSGISEANINSIFNPFFTTKEKRDGSGLGLYLVYNETEKLGGKIDVESELGTGTVFTLTFPLQRSVDNDR